MCSDEMKIEMMSGFGLLKCLEIIQSGEIINLEALHSVLAVFVVGMQLWRLYG